MNATTVALPLTASDGAPVPAGSMTEALSGGLASRWRRRFFRTVRLAAASGLLSAGAYLGQRTLNTVESDQAYLNASIIALRAPIGGRLQMDAIEPGAPLAEGAAVFRVENLRFGNLEAMSQLNWVRDSVDRLHAELTDAELRLTRQEQIFKHHEKLFTEKLISQLEYLEQETKVALCQTAVGYKKDQLRAAQERVREIEHHLELQKEAPVSMPFAGVVWAVRQRDGGEVTAHESVVQVIDPKRVWVDAFVHEKYAEKFQTGTAVVVRTLDGRETWKGIVEFVRAGAGRIEPDSSVALPPCDLKRRRVAVRVNLNQPPPFAASEFLGVGRSVVVSLAQHD